MQSAECEDDQLHDCTDGLVITNMKDDGNDDDDCQLIRYLCTQVVDGHKVANDWVERVISN